jgi:hypothetical protein
VVYRTVSSLKRIVISLALGIALAVVFASWADAQQSNATRQPAVLLFHGGGFVEGTPAWINEAADKAERRGFKTFNIDYPLWNVPAAVQTAVADARHLREKGYRVFAYGDSAGGTLAALLAERGLAKAAVANEPPSNLIEWPEDYTSDYQWQGWLNLDRQGRIRYSPAFHSSTSPILVLQSNDEFKQWNLPWAKWDPRVRYQAIPGGHISMPEYHTNTALGMDWLREQATLDRAVRWTFRGL